jgi:uncharacterized membrane protein
MKDHYYLVIDNWEKLYGLQYSCQAVVPRDYVLRALHKWHHQAVLIRVEVLDNRVSLLRPAAYIPDAVETKRQTGKAQCLRTGERQENRSFS